MRVFRGMSGVGVRPEFQLHHLLPVGVFGYGNFQPALFFCALTVSTLAFIR